MHLLPTPTTRDYKDGQANHRRNGVIQTDTLARAIFGGGVLMPTPKAGDGTKGNLKTSQERIDAGNFVDLPNVANDLALIGTPRTSSANGSTSKQVAADAPKARIEDQVLTTSWGKFEPAIRRWEQILGRPAPAPTKPDGKDGNHRLSSAFTEWMMGLPEGWITDCGLKRNDELKACGNGVVPQQAELALRILLDGVALTPNDNAVMPTLTTNGTGRHSAGYDSLGTLQMIEVAKGILPKEYKTWDEINGKIPAEWRDGAAGGGQVNLPTPTVSDTYTDNLKSTQQKPGSMHSVTLPQAVRMIEE